jgi:hypothetical protein
MDKMFEQTTKMMEQAYEQWRTMIGDSPFFPKAGGAFFQNNMSKWIESMNSTYASNMEAWDKFMQQNEEILFKMFRESPLYNETAENKMRDAWSAIVKAQKTYQDIVRESLATIENSVKESQEKE